MSATSGSVEYGKERIYFSIVYADRKTMEIAVHPDARVTVKAPKGTLLEAIWARVLKRARWIRKQISYFRAFEPRTPSRRYIGGETHMFLGRHYRLKIQKGQDQGVKLKGAFFYVTAADPRNTEDIKALLDAWYREHARSLFSKRLEIYAKVAKRLTVQSPKIRLRKMIKRWGSCTKAGDIMLNTELIKAPLYCIDYVIMHELCHLKVHQHDNEYFRLLAKYMPAWERRKERLEKILV